MAESSVGVMFCSRDPNTGSNTGGRQIQKKTGLVVVSREEVEEEEPEEEEDENWFVLSSSDKRRKRAATTDPKELTCPDSGVFDLSSCKFGAPLFVSW